MWQNKCLVPSRQVDIFVFLWGLCECCHVLEPPFLKYLNIKTPAVAMTAAAKPANIQYDVTLSALGPQRCLRGIKINLIRCLTGENVTYFLNICHWFVVYFTYGQTAICARLW